MSEPEWRRLNRANWDERVAVHLAPGSDYETDRLRQGNYVLHGPAPGPPSSQACWRRAGSSTSPTSIRRQ